MLTGKVLISSIISFIVLVVVVTGVIVVVHNNKKDTTNHHEVAAYHQKAVETICNGNEDSKLCHQVLSSAQTTNTLNLKPFIVAAVEATKESVIQALNVTDRISVELNITDPAIKMALDDCKDLMELSLDSIMLSSNLVRDNNIQALYNQSSDLHTWLSAIISYQDSCIEGFDNGTDLENKVKEQLQTQGLDRRGKLVGVALDVVAKLSNNTNSFDLKLDLNSTNFRRLVEVDSEGYPTWFSARDRNLLRKMVQEHDAPQPNAVVAKDGSGQFNTITEAIASYPMNFTGRYTIYVKAGTYDECILVPKNVVNILMYGDGPTKTLITGNKSFGDGIKTLRTATFTNKAIGFIAKSMGFENTAGASKKQAVALRNIGDMSAFFDCAMHGYQDTLYVHANRQFYRNCEISGTVDFIFGASATLIQNSKIIVRMPQNTMTTVTADGTNYTKMATGIVIQNCDIVPEEALSRARSQVKSYLGRPWRPYARTVIMESNISDFIEAEGWIPWDGDLYLETLYYAEYANVGAGANVTGRVTWKGYHPNINISEASQFTAEQFLRAGPTGKAVDWLDATGIPFFLGFIRDR